MVLFNAKAQGGKGAKIFCLFLMLILLVVGCVEAKTAETPVPPEPSPTAAEPTVEPTAAQIEEATAEITPTPSPTATDNNASSDTTVQLTILYTNDEHRADIWNVYADLEIKHGDDAAAESVLQRATQAPLNTKAMKAAFKKWIEFESKRGGDVEAVQTAAKAWVEAKKEAEK
jgi:Flp pilus assembly protein TadD